MYITKDFSFSATFSPLVRKLCMADEYQTQENIVSNNSYFKSNIKQVTHRFSNNKYWEEQWFQKSVKNFHLDSFTWDIV